MSLPDHAITLIAGGQRFTSWTGVQVVRSLDEFADAWSLEATTRWAVHEREGIAMEVDRGDSAELWWGEAEIIRGWVDEREEEIAATSWTVRFGGRSRAGDLVDCSVIKKGAWTNKTAYDIAKEIAAPFGLDVMAGPADINAPIRRFGIDGDERASEALRRLGLQMGLRVRSTPRGDVEFFQPGGAGATTATQSLRYGVNIVRARRRESEAERYSDYVVRVQAPRDDQTSGAAANIAASVKDAGVLRHRPLRIQAERSGSRANLQRRAEWERNTRVGRCDEVAIDVLPGERAWRATDRKVWEPGMLVPVYVPALDLEGQTLLVKDVTLGYGAGGYTASLVLTHPEAYQPEVPPKAKKKKGAYSW